MTGINERIENDMKLILQEVGFTKTEMDNFLKCQHEQDWIGQQNCLEEKREKY